MNKLHHIILLTIILLTPTQSFSLTQKTPTDSALAGFERYANSLKKAGKLESGASMPAVDQAIANNMPAEYKAVCKNLISERISFYSINHPTIIGYSDKIEFEKIIHADLPAREMRYIFYWQNDNLRVERREENFFLAITARNNINPDPNNHDKFNFPNLLRIAKSETTIKDSASSESISSKSEPPALANKNKIQPQTETRIKSKESNKHIYISTITAIFVIALILKKHLKNRTILKKQQLKLTGRNHERW